ncbi:MAG: TRAP transporter large permease [Dehalococcoidia bacterium]|jgi:tripartite ATP-independent transporter DctM subunit
MTPVVTGIVGLAVFFVLMALGMPIGINMILVGFCGVWYLTSFNASITVLGLSSFSTIYTYDYACLILFIIMAQIIVVSGFGTDLYTLARKWMGQFVGGLNIATIGACAVFAAMTATPLAPLVTMSAVALPEMKKSNYDMGLAAGTIAAGSTLGPLIPPSGLLIIYGILVQESIGELFMAGIVPGVVLAAMMILMIYIRGKLNPNLCPPGPKTNFKEKVTAISYGGEVIALVLLILGGIILGWFTPTEAGAVGAFGAIVFALARRRLNWRKAKEALVDILSQTGMLFVSIIGALILSRFVALSTLPMQLANFITGLDLPPLVVMALIILIYLILGAFIDMMPLFLLTVPIFTPIVVSLGFSPIWFGILLIVVTNMALLTPPVGMLVYIMSGITKEVPLETIFKGILPFVGVMLLFCFIIMFFPNLVLFLPGLMN